MKTHALLLSGIIFYCATSCAAPSFANGMQANIFSGITSTAISPSHLVYVNETDSLVPNHLHKTSFTWGLGAAYLFNVPTSANHFNYLQAVTVGLDFMHFRAVQQGQVWQ